MTADPLLRKLTARLGKGQRGFTLVELLLCIAIIAILAGIAFYYINPRKNIAAARDAERTHWAKQLEDAMYQRLVDKW